MKVNSPAVDAYQRSARVSAPNAVDRTASPQETAPSETSGVSNEPAHVTISPEARALAAGGQGIDTAKVQHLQTKIANGTYHVDPHVVAKQMLDVVG